MANDQDFLHDNPKLRAYLSAHPVLQQEFRSNPRRVMEGAYALGYVGDCPARRRDARR
jgi:hypothetical protein